MICSSLTLSVRDLNRSPFFKSSKKRWLIDEFIFCRIAPISATCKIARHCSLRVRILVRACHAVAFRQSGSDRRRAVSSVVEHLVYTERVGGSKPSPPSLRSQRGGERRLSRRSPATAGRKEDLFHLATSTRRASTRRANQK